MFASIEDVASWARARQLCSWTVSDYAGKLKHRIAAWDAATPGEAVQALESELALLGPGQYLVEVHGAGRKGGDQSGRFSAIYTHKASPAAQPQVSGVDPDRVERIVEERLHKARSVWDAEAKKEAKIAGLEAEVKLLKDQVTEGGLFGKVMAQDVLPAFVPLIPAMIAKLTGSAEPPPAPQPKQQPRQQPRPREGGGEPRPGGPATSEASQILRELAQDDPGLLETLQALRQMQLEDPEMYRSIKQS